MSCIFCREPADASRIEHILPESLGGSACLPAGLVCAKCNQYFGSKVEQLALGSFPFLIFRLLLGIPTKHGKAPFMKTRLGTVRASGAPGLIGLDPASEEIDHAVTSGEITQFRIIAEPSEPLAVCRLLLKMGLEVLASNDHQAALSERFDPARAFARAPQKNQRWWFFMDCDPAKLLPRFQEGVTQEEWEIGVDLSIVSMEGHQVFHLRLLDMSLITPLEPVFEPALELRTNEPQWRLWEVTG